MSILATSRGKSWTRKRFAVWSCASEFSNMRQHSLRVRLRATYWKELVLEFSEDVEEVSRMVPDCPKATV